MILVIPIVFQWYGPRDDGYLENATFRILLDLPIVG